MACARIRAAGAAGSSVCHWQCSEALAGAGVAAAFDAVYNPMKTRLLQDAEAEGAVAVSGVEMFVGQAAEQFLLFTGEEPPVELMRKVVVDALQ